MAAQQVTFDGEALTSESVLVHSVAHESAPDRELNSYPLPRESGDVLVSTRWGQRTVRLEGSVVADDDATLDARVDALKELLGREQRELAVVGYAGATRSYVGTFREVRFDRGRLTLASSWSAELVVTDGTGRGASVTASIPAFSVGSEFTPAVRTVTVDGTADARPVITVTMQSAWAADGFSLRNAATGERIAVMFNGAWDVGDMVVIDCAARKVYSNVLTSTLTEVDYMGVFPRLLPGPNDLEFLVGSVPVQDNHGDADPALAGVGYVLDTAGDIYAQQFELQRPEDAVKAAHLLVSYSGSATAKVNVSIQADSAGKPSLTPLASSGATTLGHPATPAWASARFSANATVAANSPYWIVIEAQSTGWVGGDQFTFWLPPGVAQGYKLGKWAKSTTGGSTFVDQPADVAFRVTSGGLDAGTDSLSVDVEYLPRYL